MHADRGRGMSGVATGFLGAIRVVRGTHTQPFARMTGDAIIHIINHVIDHKRRLDRNELQAAIDRFVESQVLIPGEWRPIEKHELKRSTRKSALLRRVCKELEECKETV